MERMDMEHFNIYWIHNPIGAPKYTKQLIPLLQSGIHYCKTYHQ